MWNFLIAICKPSDSGCHARRPEAHGIARPYRPRKRYDRSSLQR
ncbi:MAG: hypothetical protein JWN42_227 [Candidatus Angelobacter sp.]|nr:hypothetical protein [Candidatus Angelobacter sp.]